MTFKGHNSISRHDGSTQEGWASYVCGHCNNRVTGAVVASYSWQDQMRNTVRNLWVLCPGCALGSVIVQGRLIPGAAFGPKIEGLPSDVCAAYEEVRQCMKSNAYTASELLCRKILMHIGVEKGAQEGKSFVFYLDHLEKAGYVTPPMKGWVGAIRTNGNESTHSIAAPSKERAESTVMFTAELLRLTYEMEYLASKFTVS